MLTRVTGACNKTKGLKNYFLVGWVGGLCLLMLSESETIESIVLKWL
jgi:hypothetical protein